MNDKLIKWFELLIKQMRFYVDVKTGKDKLIYSYKLNSVKKALDVINNVDFVIKHGSDLENYPGIGKGMIKRIDEILTTDNLSEVNEDNISKQHLKYVDDLMKIYGIGHVKAYELYTKHNIKSIVDLKKAIKEGKIDIPENILKGIKYVDLIKENIPRKYIDKVYLLLLKTGIEVDINMDVRVCGSYRREKQTSNDIDIIISHPNIITKNQAEQSDLMKRFIIALEKKKFIVDSFTSEDVPTKYMGICKLNGKSLYRIDIRFIPQESYYTALLYFTGSSEFNKKMRKIALSMGYTLNEYRLLDDKKKPFLITSEEDVFELLHMEYLQPKFRN